MGASPGLKMIMAGRPRGLWLRLAPSLVLIILYIKKHQNLGMTVVFIVQKILFDSVKACNKAELMSRQS